MPRNHASGFLAKLLEDLGFVLRQDGDQWVAQRMSGLLKRTILLPDDPVVPGRIVMRGFWQQAIEIQEEVESAIAELREQADEVEGGQP